MNSTQPSKSQAPTLSTSKDDPESPRLRRHDGTFRRHDGLKRAKVPRRPKVLPERLCALRTCAMKFRPKRKNQTFHTPNCRKEAHALSRHAHARDAEWTEIVLGIKDKVLDPQAAAEWLKKDRANQVANVVDCTRFKGAPKHF